MCGLIIGTELKANCHLYTDTHRDRGTHNTHRENTHNTTHIHTPARTAATAEEKARPANKRVHTYTVRCTNRCTHTCTSKQQHAAHTATHTPGCHQRADLKGLASSCVLVLQQLVLVCVRVHVCSVCVFTAFINLQKWVCEATHSNVMCSSSCVCSCS